MNVRSTSRLHLLEPHHKVESALPCALPGILKDQAVEAPVLKKSYSGNPPNAIMAY